MFYNLLRSLLFRLPPETAHALTLSALEYMASVPLLPRIFSQNTLLPVEAMGLHFPNPVGLAAGLDKDGLCIEGMAALGFGFLELGTVTPRPQPGNPQPRLFRLPEHQALINRMGFNNAGVDHLVARLERRRFRGIIGVNIGKNKDTPLQQAHEDYEAAFRKVYPHASYVVVNVSSPNTQGLRSLQSIDALRRLLGTLMDARVNLAREYGCTVPLVVKLAPDLEDADLENTARLLLELGVDGIAATNTTLSRHGVEGHPHAQEQGGLSGRPLREQSLHVLKTLHAYVAPRIALIGVGGIGSGPDASARMCAGASLVQIYSGLIYRGPALIRDIVQHLSADSSWQHKLL